MENTYLDRTASSGFTGNKVIEMEPLSCPPLLLMQSSDPIISNEQCETLIKYFDHITAAVLGDATHNNLDAMQINSAQSLLEDVHDLIDKVTNCPRHDGESLIPRYVRYNPNLINNEILSDSRKLRDALLPDGCHVDTNNGKLFRHITAILYLTDNPSDDLNFGGGTTFPVARPWIGRDIATDDVMNDNTLLSSAKRLLERNVHHTKADEDQSANSDGRQLEMAGVDAFNKDAANNNVQNSNKGLRVMPKAGRLIFFHNINDDGMPDATSFHGGEELISILADEQSNPNFDRTKNILVFFKEVPVKSFTDFQSFTNCVAEARRWTKDTYY